jgi:TetR/AcrR family transcriptional regulator
MKNKAAETPGRKTTSPPRKPKAAVGRGRGRPRATQGAVGREAIVAAARQVLDKLPPHHATFSSIARKAGVDPALVRYYFSSREKLLLAVIESILTDWAASHPTPAGSPSTRLAAHMGDMLDFARQVRSMQRMMIDECAESRSAEVRHRVRDMNAGLVNFYTLLLHDEGKPARESTDPLFLYVAVLGLCEFFAAAQSMIRPLAPEGMDPEELAARYKKFIVRLVLDGLRANVEPWSTRPASSP